MRLALATDHAGFQLKKFAARMLAQDGHEVVDYGAYLYDPEDDYPDFIRLAARDVAEDPDSRKAIIFGGSGQGEAMVANRCPGVRATVYYGGNQDIIVLSREHNNANVLSLGARFLTKEGALVVIRTWLATSFSHDPRHERRIGKIDFIRA